MHYLYLLQQQNISSILMDYVRIQANTAFSILNEYGGSGDNRAMYNSLRMTMFYEGMQYLVEDILTK